MSKYDLNDAQDFQRLTLGSAAGVLQTLSLLGRDPTKWDIKEGSYTVDGVTVLFHVFESATGYQAALPRVQDNGGRRKARYTYPYRDGGTSDDLGSMAQGFEIECLFHGIRYKSALSNFLQLLNQEKPGDLQHPVRGLLRVVPETWRITHTHEQKMAAAVSVTFFEQTFEIGGLRFQGQDTAKSALTKALSALSTIDNVITNVIGAGLFGQSLVNQINEGLTEYKDRFGANLQTINLTFNIRGSSDIPGLVPTNQGGTGGTSQNTFPTARSPFDSFSQAVDAEVTSVAVAVNRITRDIASTRTFLNEQIALIQNGADGQGSLEFHSDIINLKDTAILLQDALEAGIASSRARTYEYVTPRIMSLREVAFAVGLDVSRVVELDQLNPELLSVNCIAKGTTLQVTTP